MCCRDFKIFCFLASECKACIGFAPRKVVESYFPIHGTAKQAASPGKCFQGSKQVLSDFFSKMQESCVSLH